MARDSAGRERYTGRPRRRGTADHCWHARLVCLVRTGVMAERDGDDVGRPVRWGMLLLAASHEYQILLSQVTQELLRDQLPAGAALRDLGAHQGGYIPWIRVKTGAYPVGWVDRNYLPRPIRAPACARGQSPSCRCRRRRPDPTRRRRRSVASGGSGEALAAPLFMRITRHYPFSPLNVIPSMKRRCANR